VVDVHPFLLRLLLEFPISGVGYFDGNGLHFTCFLRVSWIRVETGFPCFAAASFRRWASGADVLNAIKVVRGGWLRLFMVQ
jgi:hypothetical protein